MNDPIGTRLSQKVTRMLDRDKIVNCSGTRSLELLRKDVSDLTEHG